MSERPDVGGRRPDLSWSQLVASGVATVIAAVAASRLGVVGTLLGAAVTSVVSTAGSAILRHYLDRGKQQVLSVVTAERDAAVLTHLPGEAAETRLDLPAIPLTDADPEQTRLDPQATRLDGTPFEIIGAQVYREQGTVKVPIRRWTWPSWKVLAISAAAIFAITIGGIVAVEAATGTSLSSGSKGHDSRIIPGLGTSSDSGSTTKPSPSPSTRKPSSTPTTSAPETSAPATREPATPTPTPSTSAPSTPAPTPSPSTAQQSPAPAAAISP